MGTFYRVPMMKEEMERFFGAFQSRDMAYWARDKETLRSLFRDYSRLKEGSTAATDFDVEKMALKVGLVIAPAFLDALYSGIPIGKREILRTYRAAKRLQLLLESEIVGLLSRKGDKPTIDGGALDLIKRQEEETERIERVSRKEGIEYLGRMAEDFQRC